MPDWFALNDLLLAGLFFLAAALYGSVGHAGASAYLAAMAFVGVPATTMKPTALILNLFVASLVSFKFIRAGQFSAKLLWPFALASVPAAWLGGMLQAPAELYKPLVGVALFAAAARLFAVPAATAEESQATRPHLAVALLCGAGLGLLAGLTGTGGGIFLSPLLVFTGWANMRRASGVAAVFILLNSAAGLGGWLRDQGGAAGAALPPLGVLALWVGCVLGGGWLGAEFGSRRLETPSLCRLLAIVLLLAAAKLLLNL